jgi:sortase A
MSGIAALLPRVRLEDVGKAAAIAAIVAGLICMVEASWIHAKASLAQVLIVAAWRRELAGSHHASPWPWADTRPLARLTLGAGTQSRELMVLEGSSGRNLAFGPAHDPSSVNPGENGNSVIEGHRDTHFAALRDLKIGDTLRLQTAKSQSVSFAVTNIRVVDSRRVRVALQADHPRLTLITCYPFDALIPGGPLRLVVTADEIEWPAIDRQASR